METRAATRPQPEEEAMATGVMIAETIAAVEAAAATMIAAVGAEAEEAMIQALPSSGETSMP